MLLKIFRFKNVWFYYTQHPSSPPEGGCAETGRNVELQSKIRFRSCLKEEKDVSSMKNNNSSINVSTNFTQHRNVELHVKQDFDLV